MKTRLLKIGGPLALLVVGATAGVVLAISRGGDEPAAAVEPDNGADEYRAEHFPDSSLDVCFWAFDGAKLPDAATLTAAVGEMDITPAGKVIGLDRIAHTAVSECEEKPGPGFIVERTDPRPGQSRYIFAPLPARGPLAKDEVAAFDLWVFVVPQAAADGAGNAWGSRIKTFHLRTDNGVVVGGTRALLAGEEELRDPEMTYRLLAMALGFAGRRRELRPYIDGRCIEPGNPACGPEIGR